MKKPHLLAASVILLASAASIHAAAVIVLNPSFELPGGGPLTYAEATAWEFNTYTEISSEVGLTGGDGVRYGGMATGQRMRQDLSVTFLPDTTYTLTVALGNRITGVPAHHSGSMRFGLRSGAVEQGTFTTVDVPTAVTGGTFQDFTYIFTTGAVAPATGNIFISLGSVINSTGRGVFDNVRLDASAIPEPSTSLCALIGAGLMVVRRRRR